MSPREVNLTMDPTALPRMYTDLARYWPIISPPPHYVDQAGYWRRAIRARLGPGRHTVLELGAGGGHNMSHLSDDFAFTGSDLSPGMLEVARKLVPSVEFHLGDMRSLRLNRTFDVVMVHDAISYMLSEEDIRAVLATANAHLGDKGMFITAPDCLGESFVDPATSAYTRKRPGLEITCLEYTYDADPTDTVYEILMWFFFRENGGQARIIEDRHLCGLFPTTTWARLIGEAGFRFESEPYNFYTGIPRSLLIGVR
ncbi:MAG: class I SAM-dependent methyltransferase [Phycisphaeraceae bacterium]|nr:class I SAM-dependent methyltransferase [Phycisphaeraceae bacterium]